MPLCIQENMDTRVIPKGIKSVVSIWLHSYYLESPQRPAPCLDIQHSQSKWKRGGKPFDRIFLFNLTPAPPNKKLYTW